MRSLAVDPGHGDDRVRDRALTGTTALGGRNRVTIDILEDGRVEITFVTPDDSESWGEALKPRDAQRLRERLNRVLDPARRPYWSWKDPATGEVRECSAVWPLVRAQLQRRHPLLAYAFARQDQFEDLRYRVRSALSSARDDWRLS